MKKYKGIYNGDELSNNEYHAEQDHLSSSNIKDLIATKQKFNQTPWGIEKFHQEKILNIKKPQESKACFDEGSLVHCLILEPHVLDDEFVMFDGMRKSGKIWDTFKASEVAGKNRTILSKPQWKRCEKLVNGFKCPDTGKMVNGYKANKAAVNMVNGCQSELSLFGEFNGVPIKVRADSIDIENGIIADIKTTSYPSDFDSFKFTVDDFNYGLSAALYTKMFEEFYGRKFEFFWIVISKKTFQCEVFRMSEKTRQKGDMEILKALTLFKQCKKTGIWKQNNNSVFKTKSYDDYEILDI